MQTTTGSKARKNEDVTVFSTGTRRCSLLGMMIGEWNYDSAVAKLYEWYGGKSRYVCCSTAHMTMTAYDNREFQRVVNDADMVVADGIPIVWATRRLGLDKQVRVDAPTLTLKICALAEQRGVPIGLYGSAPEVLRELSQSLQARFPALKIPYCYSPPFRKLTDEEDREIVDEIASSGVRLLFVGLGCPKQEVWMSDHMGRVPATMLGVGWTFDVLSGREKMAPKLVQNMGLEWLYRLVQNPKRVWRRTLSCYPRFVVLALLQTLGIRQFPPSVAYTRSDMT